MKVDVTLIIEIPNAKFQIEVVRELQRVFEQVPTWNVDLVSIKEIE